MAQHGWAALSKMSATSALRVGSIVGALRCWPRSDEVDSRAARVAGRPARRAAAALCRRVRRRPVSGAGQDLHAGGLTLSESQRGRRAAGAGGRLCARCAAGSARAAPGAVRRRLPPRAPIAAQRRGRVSVRAPGQAASTARSTRPGGTAPGTHSAMISPPSEAVTSKPGAAGLRAAVARPGGAGRRGSSTGWPPRGGRLRAGRVSAPGARPAPAGGPGGGGPRAGRAAPSNHDSEHSRTDGQCQRGKDASEVMEQPGGLGTGVGEVPGQRARRGG